MAEKSIQKLINFSLINLDKPSGPTSFQVSQFVKNSLKISKTSHMGTLDPKVSGVLPITLGRACRLSHYFMHKDKTYIGIMRLHNSISKEKLELEIQNFIGKIQQIPPVRSRVKREIREREVKSFEILEIQEKDVLFKTQVQAGTYIRKLCSDFGEKTGIGAHMLELRRIKAGIFSETDENFVNLYEFEKAVLEYNNGNEKQLRKILIPAEESIKKVLPSYQLSKNANLKQILTGKPLFKSDIQITPKEEIFALFQDELFLGIYRKLEEENIIARPEFVFN